MLYLLHQAIDRAAERSPQHQAVRFKGEFLTYGQLAARSNQLARALMDRGVRRGDRVGIYQRKGLASAVALYGIMKAGAAYVPLDPDAPLARLEFIIRDCQIRHLVTEPAHADVLRSLLAHGVEVEHLVGVNSDLDLAAECLSWQDIEEYDDHRPESGTIEQDLSYILYTSGSTGVPKGVMHTHRSALSFAEIAAHTYGFHERDRLANHAPLHFDLSTLDYFSAAVAGATTIIIPEVHTKIPASLSQLLADEQVTVYYAVPFALTQLLIRGALEKRDLSSLRWVLFGGEPMPTKHLRSLMALLPRAQFSNVYGPTETNGVTYFLVPPLPDDTDEPIPIGGLFGNVEALVLDEHDAEVTDDREGELLIRAPTLMRGYWGHPDWTDRVRYRRPAPGPHEDLFHRTGDIVRRRPDGTFMFLGRRDRQVKVRGSRVELDEIEAVLVTHESVEAAAAYLVTNGDGGRSIEVALTIRSGAPIEAPDLIRYAAERLPPYAVPETIVIHTHLPRTSTGKVDRIHLQEQSKAGLNEPPSTSLRNEQHATQ